MEVEARPGEERATGFQFAPVGPFVLRNYDDEKLSDLEPVLEHVEALMTQHRTLIPGGMVRLMRGWHSDLLTAISAKTGHQRPCDTD